MKTFAIVNEGVIVNTFIAVNQEKAEAVGGSSVIEVDPRVGIGFRLDEESGLYKPTSPYHSWVFDESNYQWVAPVEKPEDGNHYWNEADGQWDLFVEVESPELLELTPVEEDPNATDA